MTNYKALCAELADELSVWTGYGDDAGVFPEADFDGVHALITRARAALAEQPVGQPCALPTTPPIPVSERLPQVKVILRDIHNPTPQPVPMAERLPCLEDCDEQGRCWFHSTGRAWCDWYLLKASSATDTETHWLPSSALPTPETP